MPSTIYREPAILDVRLRRGTTHEFIKGDLMPVPHDAAFLVLSRNPDKATKKIKFRYDWFADSDSAHRFVDRIIDGDGAPEAMGDFMEAGNRAPTKEAEDVEF